MVEADLCTFPGANTLLLGSDFKKKKKTFRAFKSRDEFYMSFSSELQVLTFFFFNYILNINSNWKMIKHNTEKQ